MKRTVENHILEINRSRRQTLERQIADARRILSTVASRNDEGHTVQRDLGSFADGLIDKDGLAIMVESAHKEKAGDERLARQAGLHLEVLKGSSVLLEDYHGYYIDYDHTLRDTSGIKEYYKTWLKLFRAIRFAGLVKTNRYKPDSHDGALERLDWRNLRQDEFELLPSIICEVEIGELTGEVVGQLFNLFNMALPVKVIVYQLETGRLHSLEGRQVTLDMHHDLCMQFLLMGGVYLVQASMADGQFMMESINKAFNSFRPALISIFELPEKQALKALRARTIVHLTYDPDRADNPGECLDISANPSYEQRLVDVAESPAHYIVEAEKLKLIPSDNGVDLIEWLSEGGNEKLPVINDGQANLIVPVDVVSYTRDKLHAWDTLRFISGLDNPMVNRSSAELRQSLEEEHRQALAAQKETLERDHDARKEAALKSAMKNLVSNLMQRQGLDVPVTANAGTNTAPAPAANAKAAPAQQPASTPASPAAEPAPAAAPATGGGEEAWIESELCTACDECITINKGIFAYNDNKQAYVKNARGGPFRDLVKAAEKCSAKIIHPGSPLDAKEKDIDKWVKRAEKYN